MKEVIPTRFSPSSRPFYFLFCNLSIILQYFNFSTFQPFNITSNKPLFYHTKVFAHQQSFILTSKTIKTEFPLSKQSSLREPLGSLSPHHVFSTPPQILRPLQHTRPQTSKANRLELSHPQIKPCDLEKYLPVPARLFLNHTSDTILLVSNLVAFQLLCSINIALLVLATKV